MADFFEAYEKTIRNEGGYKLENVTGDRGGLTYAGIARRWHPEWPGWSLIDKRDLENPELTTLVRSFYKLNFWDKIKGYKIRSQVIAESIYDFGVNAGWKISLKLAQVSVGTTPDGIIGPKTLEALNEIDEELFLLRFAMAKVARYANICQKNPTQKKFLLGWINRVLKGVS